ncbi:hypothetical protein [Haloactinomyces albus]|uniref:Uncharacterized protein n=1 Tax=Haloactinomyces albus TaxID=1352928 RepID=A0AAE4CNS0_9ACTN|nr:hypothetical protein [Haloactinomyces albus]MDR7302337.1 hypothetical protein [Haloactinomyces albus]
MAEAVIVLAVLAVLLGLLAWTPQADLDRARGRAREHASECTSGREADRQSAEQTEWMRRPPVGKA